MLLYIYLVPALLGLLSMPSVHAAWKKNHPHDNDWFKTKWNGEYDYIGGPDSQPMFLFFGSVAWPLFLAVYLSYKMVMITRLNKVPGLLWNLMALPGRYIAGNPPDFKAFAAKLKPKKDPYLLAGEREVEEFLTPSHHRAME